MSASPELQNTSFSPAQSPEPPLELLPSHQAASRDDVAKMCDILEEGGTLIDPKTNENPIHAAARSGAKKALLYLLDKNIADPAAKGSSGYTPAHYAAVYGHFECLKVCVLTLICLSRFKLKISLFFFFLALASTKERVE